MWKKRRQNGFLIIELLLSFLILFAVSTLIYSEMKKYNVPLGFNPEQVGVAFIDFDQVKSKLKNSEAGKTGYDVAAFEQKLALVKQEVLSVEGINDASYSINVIPFSNSNWRSSDERDDKKVISYEGAFIIFSDEDYGKVLEPQMEQGRWFTEEDIMQKNNPVVVNKEFVNQFIQNDEPVIGQKLYLWDSLMQIVGVTEHFKYQGEFRDEEPMLLPYLIKSELTNSLLFRYDEQVNPNWEVDIQNVLEKTLKDVSFFQYKLDDAREKNSRSTWVTIVSLLALALFLIINVAMGIFGMLQYSIKKRQGEIGLRKALGASHGSIRKQFLLEIIIITTLAVGVGLLLAIQVPILNLFDIPNQDFYVAIIVSTLFIYTLVVISSLIPSIQAAKIQPAIALHENG